MAGLSRYRKPTIAFRVWQGFALTSLALQAGLFLVPGLGSAIAKLPANSAAEDAAVEAAWAIPAWPIIINCVFGAGCMIGYLVTARAQQFGVLPGTIVFAVLGYGLVPFLISASSPAPNGLLYTWGREPVHLGWHWLGAAVIVPVLIVVLVRYLQLRPQYRALLAEESVV